MGNHEMKGSTTPQRHVADVMHRHIASVRSQTPATEAQLVLRGSGRDAVPVLDTMGALHGVVSDRALAGVRENGSTLRVRDLMSVPHGVIGPCAPLTTAVRLMRERGLGEMLVIDEGGHLIGVVTLGDAVAATADPEE